MQNIRIGMKREIGKTENEKKLCSRGENSATFAMVIQVMIQDHITSNRPSCYPYPTPDLTRQASSYALVRQYRDGICILNLAYDSTSGVLQSIFHE